MPTVTLKVPYRITHYRDGVVGEDEIVAIVHYTPGHPGSWYKSNGDPGDPPDPSEVEVLAVESGGETYGPDVLHAIDRWRWNDYEQLADDDDFLTACDEAYADYMEAQAMSDKAMPLTIDEAIARLDAIGYEYDPEMTHVDADNILLSHVDPRVAEAYRRVINRQGSWWFS